MNASMFNAPVIKSKKETHLEKKLWMLPLAHRANCNQIEKVSNTIF